MGKMSIKGLALSLGIIWAFCVLVLGWIAMTGYGAKFVELISTVYIGYKPTLLGGIIGAAYGFVDGAVGGLLVALLYNVFAGKGK